MCFELDSEPPVPHIAGAAVSHDDLVLESAAPVDRAREIEAPVLALQAGADQSITADDNAAFERALTEAGVEHELVTYDGAPHSFFDRRQEDFADASDDAWERVLEFIEQHSGHSSE